MVAKHDGIPLKSNKQFMWFSWKNWISAYHLYGKPRISGKNSNETVHPLGSFRVKRYYLPRYMFHLFYRFYRNDQKFSVPLVWITSTTGLSSREKTRKILPVFCKWYNSIPFMFSMRKKIIIIIKIPVPFVGKFWSIFQFTSYFLLLRTELSLPRSRFCLVT